MLPLATRIHVEAPAAERRRARRHALAFPVAGPSGAIIENLSEDGLALRTGAGLQVGDRFQIELPSCGTVEARVAWSEAGLLGCEFLEPISKGAVSAARLRAPASMSAAAHAVVLWTPPVSGLQSRYGLAIGVLLALALVVGMFLVALLTAPAAIY